jgi:hypothetical protein
MSNNIYDILGKLNGLVPKENPVSTAEPVYESVDPRGDIMEAVTGLEKKYAEFNENIVAEKKKRKSAEKIKQPDAGDITSADATINQLLTKARFSRPGAKNDLEAMVYHIAKQDEELERAKAAEEEDRMLIKKAQAVTDQMNDRFKKLKTILLSDKNSIIILGGRFPLYLSNFYFDNQEGGIEIGSNGSNEWDRKIILNDKSNTLQDSFKNQLLEISKNNKIILVYPIPEVGFDINHKIYLLWIKNKNSFNKNLFLVNMNTSYQIYKNRTKSSFELLDYVQGDNIYRVYPDTLFCNTIVKNRCTTHDKKNIFYSDDDHLSLKGAQMINDLIMKEIENIELRSK